MKNLIKLSCCFIIISWGLFLGKVQGQIVQWNFNGSSSTTVPGGTGSPTPISGLGVASLIGGASASFASGTSNGGSSDPVTTSPSNYGWNITTFNSQGNSSPRGVRFNASTVGYQSIQLSFDLRFSNTSSRWVRLQYTTDGSNFIDYTGPLTDSLNLYRTLSGDSWKRNIRADFTSLPNTNDNPMFGVRIIQAFAPGGSAYAAASSSSTYAATGTWRFDMVTISGTALPASPFITFNNPISNCDSNQNSGYIIASVINVTSPPPYTFIWNNSVFRSKSVPLDTLFVQTTDTVRLTVQLDSITSTSNIFEPSNIFLHPADPSDLNVSGISNSSATFSWSSCDEELISGYQIWLSGGLGVLNIGKVTSFTINTLNPGTTYNWSIRARYPQNPEASLWISGSNFTTTGADPCVIGQPTGLIASNITDTTVTLSWQPMAGATRYRVWITGRGTQIISGNSIDLINLATGTNYNWTVAGICASGVFSALTASSFITTGSAACVAPTNFNSSYVDPISTFTWNAVPANLPRYQIWIQGIGVVNPALTSPSFSTPAVPNGNTVSWTVRTLCAGGVASAWANPRNSFTAAKLSSLMKEDIMSPEEIERADQIFINNQNSSEFYIYPNPSKDFVHIEIPHGDFSIESLRIIDMKGSVLKEVTSTIDENLTIDVQSIPAGIYTIQILTKGKSEIKKWIKE